MTNPPQTNSVYWEEVPQLLESGWTIKAYGSESPKAYYVAISSSEENEKVVVDRKASTAAPATIDATELFYMIATHGSDDEIQLPLNQNRVEGGRHDTAQIKMVKPNPNILWTIAFDGKHLTGDKNKPQRFTSLGAALETAAVAGTSEARINVSKAARKYFQIRKNRADLINSALRELNLNLRTWCLDNGHDYATVYRVLNRGDDIPEVRELLARLANTTKERLWPSVNWPR